MLLIPNHTDKNIKEFTEKDTIYLQKLVEGYACIFYCRFVSYRRRVTGVVIHKVRGISNQIEQGDVISTKLGKCCLYKSESEAAWFTTKGHAI